MLVSFKWFLVLLIPNKIFLILFITSKTVLVHCILVQISLLFSSYWEFVVIIFVLIIEWPILNNLQLKSTQQRMLIDPERIWPLGNIFFLNKLSIRPSTFITSKVCLSIKLRLLRSWSISSDFPFVPINRRLGERSMVSAVFVL